MLKVENIVLLTLLGTVAIIIRAWLKYQYPKNGGEEGEE